MRPPPRLTELTHIGKGKLQRGNAGEGVVGGMIKMKQGLFMQGEISLGVEASLL